MITTIDLTQNKTPFGDLSPEVKLMLFEADKNCVSMQRLFGGVWRDCVPIFVDNVVYRVTP